MKLVNKESILITIKQLVRTILHTSTWGISL